MVWLIGLLGWMYWSVLRGRGGFVRGAGASLVAAVRLLGVANPDARIAEVNLSREADSIDADYLHQLSADALPAIAARSKGIPPDQRAAVCKVLYPEAVIHQTRHDSWPLLSWSLPRAQATPHRCE